MLKKFLFPVNFNKQISQICGEIICENLKEFFIYCKCCQVKIFEFEEFIHHFTNSHLDQVTKEISNTKNVNVQTELIEENFENIKLEITEILEQNKAKDENQNEEIMWNPNNSIDVDDRENNERTSDDDDEAQSKSILKKKSISSNRIQESFKCSLCKRSYSNKFYYRKHIESHKNHLFKCDKCSKTFAKKIEFQQHFITHNGYSCELCPRVFRSYASFHYHKGTHIKTKNFSCDFKSCNKSFVNKTRLNVHRRRHFQESKYMCEVCGVRKPDKRALMDHIRKHTGEKPFACPVCDRRFTTNSLMNEHKVCHETERKHVCDVCGKSFNRPKALYHHKPLHLGIKKFKCKLCGAAYAQAAGLSAHMRKHKENKICSKDIN